ncbi:MAG TPA: WD40 repeat domain-containing protein, partial [Terrimicrobiaceae bacterium]|nr:WD40 repeat domain-containing protein [Terrimicrobiaceae bacterium]
QFVSENEESPTILSIAFRRDGSWLAQRDDGSYVVLPRDSPTPQLSDGRSFMSSAALSADGERLAFVADRQDQIHVGALQQPWKAIPVEPSDAQITALAFKPDDSLAVATATGKVLLISTAGEKRTLREPTGAKVLSLAWRNNDEPALLAGDEKGDVALLQNGVAPRVLATAPSRVQDLAWSPDGTSFAAACADGRVRIWAVSEDPAPAASLIEDLPAHQGAALSVAWNSSGSRLASGGDDGVVSLWQPAERFGPVITRAIGPPLHSLSVSQDGSRIVAGSENGDIFTWDVQSKALATASQSGGRILSLAWQPEHQTFASGSESGEINIWDHSVRDRVASLQPETLNGGDDQTIWRVRWSHDGTKLASSSHNGTVQVWEPGSRIKPRVVGKMPDYALGLAWNPDDTMIATGSTHGEIWLWKATGASESIRKISGGAGRGHADSVSSLAFLPGGKVLASCGRDGTLWLWDVRSGTALARSPSVDAFLDDLAVSADGAKIATVGTDGYLRIWEKDTLTPHLALALHQRPAAAVAWHGSHIYSASEDGTIRALDLNEAIWKERARRLIGVDVRQSRPADQEPKQIH